MGRLDGISFNVSVSVSPGVDRLSLRMAHVPESPAGAVRPVTRDNVLAQKLDERLSSRLDAIRAGIDSPPGASSDIAAASPPGTGQRLDILA